MKEGVVLNLDGVTTSQPFRNYIEQRNGQVAQDLATYFGIPFLGTQNGQGGDFYYVPAKTVEASDAIKLGIENSRDLYGAIASKRTATGKSILHPSVSNITPDFYNPEFAELIQDLVLPGFVGFNPLDILKGYNFFSRSFPARLKLSNESDGLGQFPIQDKLHLEQIIEKIDPSIIAEEGVVLEPELQNPKTISVGFAQIGTKLLSFIAKQKNDVADDDGQLRNRYLGAVVTVVSGDLEQLQTIEGLSEIDLEAVTKCIQFNQHYQKNMDIIASRLSYDFLFGQNDQGQIFSGITDITGRLGGTCPAIMMALSRLQNNPIDPVKTEVTLNYQPKNLLESEKDAKTYLNHQSLRISARIQI
jgi:hypothetical protein